MSKQLIAVILLFFIAFTPPKSLVKATKKSTILDLGKYTSGYHIQLSYPKVSFQHYRAYFSITQPLKELYDPFFKLYKVIEPSDTSDTFEMFINKQNQ